jgi:hypothetical protein
MRRFIILCWLVAGSVTALTLFQIKQEVRVLEDEIAATQRTILENQEAVHVLEAEWSYLNAPARIGALAERHLELAPIPAERIVGFDDLPLPGQPEDDVPGATEPPRDPSATLVKAATNGVLRP